MIGGHLDSRVSDVMNAKDFAPGANDDGSHGRCCNRIC